MKMVVRVCSVFLRNPGLMILGYRMFEERMLMWEMSSRRNVE